MDEDKKKLCDWIMSMDIEDFYSVCSLLEENYEFTGKQLFYSCQECGKEHSDVCCASDVGMCKEFFIKHYTEGKPAGVTT